MIRSLFLSILTFALVALAGPIRAACIAPTGEDSAPAINLALTNAGLGGAAYLCRSTSYLIQSPIRFAHPNQLLTTEGFDTGNTNLAYRARLNVHNVNQATAVSGHDVPGSWLKWVSIDGAAGFYGHIVGGGALVDFGGSDTSSYGRNQEIHGCEIREPRGWSAVFVSAGVGTCNGVVVSNNDIGPAGQPTNNRWADGISYQCRDGFVTGNLIFDATDGGIVVFGSPGSLIADNRIEAITRELFGGINLVDTGAGVNIFKTPTGDGDFRGTRVYNNSITAISAFIHIGIGSGPNVWWSSCGDSVRNDGALIDYNTLGGGYMGYGFAVDGVRNWTIANNTDNSTHVYRTRGSGCKGTISVPGRFQVYSARSVLTWSANSHSFLEATLDNALSVDY